MYFLHSRATLYVTESSLALNLRRVMVAVSKEIRLILRDKEALLILFVMPAVFVLILSLALRDSFQERAGARFPLLIVNQDRGWVGQKLVEGFSEHTSFRTEVISADMQAPSEAALTADLASGRYKFVILIPTETTSRAVRRLQQEIEHSDNKVEPVALRLLADPTMRGEQRALAQAAVNRALQGIEVALLLQHFASTGQQLIQPRGDQSPPANIPTVFAEIKDSAEQANAPIPTSVQQNAPAWTVLAMFFLVIPLSVALIKERQAGTLVRLQAMRVPAWVVLAGKILPYFVINQLQLVLILLEGIYLLPHLGSDALTIGNAPGAIALVSIAASCSAIGFGLLIASLSRTPEQATTFGATSVLVLAAVGGIMVPKIVMPPAMQRVADISPLSWGLEGFLDVFVRGGGVSAVLPEFTGLMLFAGACLTIAVWQFTRRMANLS